MKISELKRLIKEEMEKVKGKTSKLKKIAYDIGNEMGLRKAYHGAFLSFDGKWKDLDISVEYNGSHGTLKVNVSPKFNPPTNSQVLDITFDENLDYIVKRGSEKISSHNYSSIESFLDVVSNLSKYFD